MTKRLTEREELEQERQYEKKFYDGIRAKYGSLWEWKKKEFFSMATLKHRGWNTALVKKHLGECDETTSGAYRAAELWLKKSVFAAEKLPEVKAAIKATTKRMEKLATAANDAHKRVNAEVAKWPMKLISRAEVIRRKLYCYDKKLGKETRDSLIRQRMIDAACEALEPMVLAQPKHQRLYRQCVMLRAYDMADKK
jgi:hypothetical protein